MLFRALALSFCLSAAFSSVASASGVRATLSTCLFSPPSAICPSEENAASDRDVSVKRPMDFSITDFPSGPTYAVDLSIDEPGEAPFRLSGTVLAGSEAIFRVGTDVSYAAEATESLSPWWIDPFGLVSALFGEPSSEVSLRTGLLRLGGLAVVSAKPSGQNETEVSFLVRVDRLRELRDVRFGAMTVQLPDVASWSVLSSARLRDGEEVMETGRSASIRLGGEAVAGVGSSSEDRSAGSVTLRVRRLDDGAS
jgi:hypothetical protein